LKIQDYGRPQPVPGRIARALPAQKLNRFAAPLPNDAARVADLRIPRVPSFRIELDGALKSLILIVFPGKPAAFPDPHRVRATPVARGLRFSLAVRRWTNFWRR
jgi:hypothetical protein